MNLIQLRNPRNHSLMRGNYQFEELGAFTVLQKSSKKFIMEKK